MGLSQLWNILHICIEQINLLTPQKSALQL